MLSDHERETLDEIQLRLVADDPQFAGSFHDAARCLPVRGSRLRKSTVTVLLVVALLLNVLMIAVHAAGPALFFTAVACWLIWLRRGRHARYGSQGP